jgi:undecaprenyl diphosphate synthase
MNPIKHVAIIMDGNGRWGIKNKGSRNSGHRAGLNTVETVIEECIKEKIQYLTLYTFSTENWKRPKKEIDFLFNLLQNFLKHKIENIIKKKIKLNFIGELNKLPSTLKNLIKLSEKKTKKNELIQVNVALNYGSKSELLRAIRLINKKKMIINEKNIDKNLFTNNITNPDILIRTGNTKRLSNFMLWQMAYTEIFFEKKLWPEFNKKDFRIILNSFKIIKRNFGSVNEF